VAQDTVRVGAMVTHVDVDREGIERTWLRCRNLAAQTTGRGA